MGYCWTQRQVEVMKGGKMEAAMGRSCVRRRETERRSERGGKKNQKLHEGDLHCSLGDLSHLYWLDWLLS